MDANNKSLTTDITEVDECGEPIPEWIVNAKGLVYLPDHDGFLDPDAVKITPPECSIDSTIAPTYQCIKCGNKQTSREEIFRIKCTRCMSKAFNKIRPTKWVKFKAN